MLVQIIKMGTTCADVPANSCNIESSWDTGIAQLAGRRKTKEGVKYLVVWQDGSGESWELDEDLVEEGYTKMIEAYEVGRKKRAAKSQKKRCEKRRAPPAPAYYVPWYRNYNTVTAPARPTTTQLVRRLDTHNWDVVPAVSWDDVFYPKLNKNKKAREEAREKKEKAAKLTARAQRDIRRRLREVAELNHDENPKMNANPFDIMPNLLTSVTSKFNNIGGEVLGIYNVLRKDHLAQFRGMHGLHNVELVFHGTPTAEAMASIIRTGLKVPLTGKSQIKVRHGSAHGVGVYTAVSPAIPTGYTGGSSVMFVCLASRTGSHWGEVRVFSQNNAVIPMAVVAYSMNGGKNEQQPQYHHAIPPAEEGVTF